MRESLYHQYMKDVAVPGDTKDQYGIAANLPTVKAFLEEVNLNDCKIVADLGSGISSVAIAHATNVEKIYSVDNHWAWLEKTRKFVEANVDSYDNEKHEWWMWNDWRQVSMKCDFIFYDMFYTKSRIKFMEEITLKLKKGGFILYDDCHKLRLRNKVKMIAKKHDLTLVKRILPIDDRGRWSNLYVKN